MANMRSLKRSAQTTAQKKKPTEMKTLGMARDMADKEKSAGVDPVKMKNYEGLTSMMVRLLHSDETRPAVLDLLKSNSDPNIAIPVAGNNILQNIDKRLEKGQQKISNEVKVAAAQGLVTDLIKLGNSEKLWETPVAEEAVPQIYQDTLQKYIETGVANNTLDPIQLQREAEQLMNDQQKEIGGEMQQRGNLPPAPTPEMAARQSTDEAVRAEQAKGEQAIKQKDIMMQAQQMQQGQPQAQAQPVQQPSALAQ